MSVQEAKEKIRRKHQLAQESALKKARLAITRQINKAKKDQKEAGIRARKTNKGRRDKISELEGLRQEVPPELRVVEREPDKNPTSNELDDLQPHLSLVQAVQELERLAANEPPVVEQTNGFTLAEQANTIPVIDEPDLYDSDSDIEITTCNYNWRNRMPISNYNWNNRSPTNHSIQQEVRIIDDMVTVQRGQREQNQHQGQHRQRQDNEQDFISLDL